jgi:hypothetical protein
VLCLIPEQKSLFNPGLSKVSLVARFTRRKALPQPKRSGESNQEHASTSINAHTSIQAMGFFKRKKQATSASSPSESAGRDPERTASRWSRNKAHGTPLDAGGIPSSSTDTTTQRERLEDRPKGTLSSHYAPEDHENLHAQSLWDHAYDTLKKDQPDLVTKYEKLLSDDLSTKGAFIALYSICCSYR